MTSKVALLQFVSGLSSKALKKPTIPFEGHHTMKHNWAYTHCSLKSEISANAQKCWVQNTNPRFADDNIEINTKLLHECYITFTYRKRFVLRRSNATLWFEK
jgi:hypothetical protein